MWHDFTAELCSRWLRKKWHWKITPKIFGKGIRIHIQWATCANWRDIATSLSWTPACQATQSLGARRMVSCCIEISIINSLITFRAELQQIDISVEWHDHLQISLDWCGELDNRYHVHVCTPLWVLSICGTVHVCIIVWCHPWILSHFGQILLVWVESHKCLLHSSICPGQVHSSSMICGELYRKSQKTTSNTYLDSIVQNGLACGLWGSVWLCPELSRTKCFPDAGSDDMTVQVWDAQTGAQVGFKPLQWHTSTVGMSVAFSPDGRHIVSGSFDKTIEVWNTQAHSQVGDDVQVITFPINFSSSQTHAL